VSTTPWRVEWTNSDQSIGYDRRSRIVDAEGNWVAEIGDGVWDRIAQHEALASLIVSAVNERESQAAQIAALTAERDALTKALLAFRSAGIDLGRGAHPKWFHLVQQCDDALAARTQAPKP